MSKLQVFKVKDWVVLGKNIFKPPFKVTDKLINEARIIYVVQGRSNLYAANQFMSLNSGNTLIMKSDNFINHWLANESEEPNEVIVFQITSELLKHIYRNQLPIWFVENPDKQVAPIQKQADHLLLNEFFKNLRLYFDTPALLSEELIQLKVKELLHLLANSDLSGNNKKILGSLFQANEYKFQEVIQAHLFDDLNLEDLAFLTGLSLSSFKRKFSSIYGTTPNKYFASKRLEKAQLLLRTSTLRISEIAYACGYSDVGYFTTVFQRQFGTSPSKFREKLLS